MRAAVDVMGGDRAEKPPSSKDASTQFIYWTATIGFIWSATKRVISTTAGTPPAA